jgi:hypothetical protein
MNEEINVECSLSMLTHVVYIRRSKGSIGNLDQSNHKPPTINYKLLNACTTLLTGSPMTL